MTVNLQAAWIGILLGFIAGAAPGLFFHKEDWLGGYGSWRRRMLRLAHISFFGIGMINAAFVLTLEVLKTGGGMHESMLWPSRLLIAGAIAMPAVCYLSAWRKSFRHLFCIPVLCLTLGVGMLLGKGVL
jgi:hypothetical protein